MSRRTSHKRAIRQLLERSIGTSSSDLFKDNLTEEILRIHDRFNCNTTLDEALNMGDGTYKP